jgi:uncharacterized protein (DUF58 family)
LAVLATISVLLWLATRSTPQLVIGVAIWAAIVIDAVLVWRAMRTVAVELAVPPLVTTADPLPCTVRVTGARRPLTLAPAARPNVQRFLIEGPDPGLLTLAPRRRGLVHSLMVDATVTGPLGLLDCARRIRIALLRSAVVGPEIAPHPVPFPRPRAVNFGLTESAPVGDDLFRTVRPYVRGDSRRRVHWKASAHHGSLMIKESDGTGIATLRIIVQLDGPGADSESAVARAARVATDSLARGWWTELVTIQPRTVPMAAPAGLGSPFSAPPLDLAPALGPTHVVTRRVDSEQAVLTTLATAGYGAIGIGRGRGLTYVATPNGDRWL